MAVKVWQPEKICFCDRVGKEVALEVEMVYPSDIMPDMVERVMAHRCSHASECTWFEKPACIWSGSHPTYDPFEEKETKKK